MLLQAINNLAIFQQPSFVQRLREAILYHYGATIGHFKIFFRFLEKTNPTPLSYLCLDEVHIVDGLDELPP